jgi:hypothetical protein
MSGETCCKLRPEPLDFGSRPRHKLSPAGFVSSGATRKLASARVGAAAKRGQGVEALPVSGKSAADIASDLKGARWKIELASRSRRTAVSYHLDWDTEMGVR